MNKNEIPERETMADTIVGPDNRVAAAFDVFAISFVVLLNLKNK